MSILLCSQNDTILRRWKDALRSVHTVHEATTIGNALRILTKNRIDLILLHRTLVDEKKITEFVTGYPETKMFILSDRPENAEGIRCLKLGCAGYSNTYISPARLALAVQTVQSGLIWTGTALLQHLLRNTEESASLDKEIPDTKADITARLSNRELQVASLVSEGLQNKEIAGRLGITERTVKAHLSAVYSKTGTSTRIGLAKKLDRN